MLVDHPVLPRFTRRVRLLALSLFALALPLASAQETSTYKEQSKLIRAPRAFTTLGTDLFGDKLNLYTGSLEFVQTDVSLPGNNALPVSVGRRLTVGQLGTNGTLFGHWDLEIPHLHGVFSTVAGWTTSQSTNTSARCSAFGAPPLVNGSYEPNSQWNGTEYWNGSFLYVPGAGDQEMLRRNPSYTQAPTANAAFTFPVVTRNNWAIRCLPSMAANNGGAGEGFVAVSPDGTQYQFDWMVSRDLPLLRKSNGAPVARGGDVAPPPGTDAINGYALRRSEVWILPTVVTDRFGNTVTYTYDTTNKWQLKTIVANDAAGSARTITLSYQTPGSTTSNLVSSVTDGTRTWTYSYDSTVPLTANLATVTQPDGAAWQLNTLAPLLVNLEYLGEGDCSNPAGLNAPVITGSLNHPSGAHGEFTLSPVSHGRAGVDYQCNTDATTSTEAPYYPKVFDTYSLTKKAISGTGLTTMNWTTSYAAEASSWAPCNGCNATTQVLVVDPAGDKLRYTFGTLFRQTESQLLLTELIESNDSVLRTTALRYAEPVTPYGTSDQKRGDGEFSARVTETDRKIISQQGVDFTWQANSFDSFAKPLQVARSSVLGARTETSTYNNNLAKWILGQVASVTESSTGQVMVLNGYNATSSTLDSVTKFGHLEQSMSYNTDGTLATRRDGLNQTTTFSNYKRGIPQNVQYADASTESAVVSNIGTISSLTDALSITTAFSYDSMGRLATVIYPSGDPVSWNPTTITFQSVASAEFGVPAGHWRQDVTTGTARTSTYFDALWRPVVVFKGDLNDPANTNRFVINRYDHKGQLTYSAYPLRSFSDTGNGTYQDFDALGRPTVTSTTSELGTLYSGYAYQNSFITNFTDARGKTSLTQYQAFDEPSQDLITSISSPGAIVTNIARDVFGKPGAIVRSGPGPGGATVSVLRQYVYDGYQRLCKSIDPETASTIKDYDAANNVMMTASGLALPSTSSCDTASVPAAKKIIIIYDALNRPKTTTYGDGSASVARTYWADGLPNTIVSNGSTWTSTYNRRRLMTSENLAYGGVNYNIVRAYDANGSLSQLSYPIDGLAVDYLPNALGEPRKVGNYANGITYYPNGAINSFTYGNGIVHTSHQNARQLPDLNNDAGVTNDAYTYDENGSLHSITDNQRNLNSRTMGYDDLGRLTSVLAPQSWGTATYEYDGIDNLTKSTITGGGSARSLTHAFDANNRLGSILGTGEPFNAYYSYDSQGNVATRRDLGYTFDIANRMTAVNGRATYLYDGLGHRFSTVTSTTNVVQVYTQAGQLLQTGAAGTAGTRYIYLHNHVLAEVAGGTVTFNHTDALGSPVAQTSGAGALLNTTTYEPYGYVSAGTKHNIGFTGHVNDNESGLIYMQQRYYDPIAGRMLSIDPVTTDANTGGSFNRYAYANNSPYKFVDPDGRNAALFLRLEFRVVYQLTEATGIGSRLGLALADMYSSDVAAGNAALAASANPARPNDGANTGGGKTGPPLPDKIVGDQTDPKAGPNKGGGKHTSGPLTPANGGKGDFGADLNTLTGGARPREPGDKAPPGSLVGPNGIFGRPENSTGGQSIDIPANGDKPHETLHYP